MKVVINNCFGGFSISAKAVRRYAELKGFEVFAYGDSRMIDGNFQNKERIIKLTADQENKQMCVYWIKEDLGKETTSEKLNKAEWFHERDIPRNDEILVQVVRELKKEANGRCAELKIINIPKDVDWEIDEYDGLEKVAEKHRTWS